MVSQFYFQLSSGARDGLIFKLDNHCYPYRPYMSYDKVIVRIITYPLTVVGKINV